MKVRHKICWKFGKNSVTIQWKFGENSVGNLAKIWPKFSENLAGNMGRKFISYRCWLQGFGCLSWGFTDWLNSDSDQSTFFFISDWPYHLTHLFVKILVWFLCVPIQQHSIANGWNAKRAILSSLLFMRSQTYVVQ